MPPIAATDIVLRLSGGASNTDPDASLGGAMSTAPGGVITTAQLNNLFDDVSGDQAAAGDVNYRAFFIENDHASLTLSNIKLWINTVSPSPDTAFAIALCEEGKNSAIEVEADEVTPPSGESFSSPTNKAAGLSLPDLDAGDYIGIWIRRTVSASASAVASDGPTLRVEGDTPA